MYVEENLEVNNNTVYIIFGDLNCEAKYKSIKLKNLCSPTCIKTASKV